MQGECRSFGSIPTLMLQTAAIRFDSLSVRCGGVAQPLNVLLRIDFIPKYNRHGFTEDHDNCKARLWRAFIKEAANCRSNI